MGYVRAMSAISAPEVDKRVVPLENVCGSWVDEDGERAQSVWLRLKERDVLA